jgi:heme/copper-type cytochrome/quinol oxidase subunit 1
MGRPNYAYTIKQGWRKELKKRNIKIYIYIYIFRCFYQILAGMPRRIPDYPDAYIGWNAFSSFGSYVFIIRIFCFFVVVFLSLESTLLYRKSVFEKYSENYLLSETQH